LRVAAAVDLSPVKSADLDLVSTWFTPDLHLIYAQASFCHKFLAPLSRAAGWLYARVTVPRRRRTTPTALAYKHEQMMALSRAEM
jgi:hypothetical protein